MTQQAGSRPNIVMVFMDDMGYGDMGCFGSTLIRTPVMDRLAAEGARFAQMYAAAPICSPSRAGLLTGRYAQRMGVERVLFPKDTKGIRDEDRTFADYLRHAGYATCMLGKWHLGCLPQHNPVRHGFDSYFGLLYSNDMDPLHLYRGIQAIETDVDQATLTGRYSDEAIAFIEDRHADGPFMVYLAHTMPHIPLHVEEAFRHKSEAGTYGDTIECIDHHLGRIVDTLDELGLRDNTLVIVTSDNGPWFEGSAGPFRGRKFENYEGGIRMPFVANWPGVIPQGTVCDETASLMDMLPTFLHLAGTDIGAGPALDGINIWPAFTGGPCPRREARGGRAEMPQLYDMDRDGGESYDLSDLYPDVTERLTALMRTFDAEIQTNRPAQADDED